MEAVLGRTGGGASGAAAAGGRHRPAHPADAAPAMADADRRAAAGRAHRPAQSRRPDDAAALHRRGAARLRAVLPERAPERRPSAGGAGAADGAVRRRRSLAGPVLCSGRPGAVPSGPAGNAGPAGRHFVSGPLARRARNTGGAVWGRAGQPFGRTDRRRAERHRPEPQRPDLPRTGSIGSSDRTGCRRSSAAQPPGRSPRRRLGRLFPPELRAAALHPAGGPAQPEFLPADRLCSPGLHPAGRHPRISREPRGGVPVGRPARRVGPQGGHLHRHRGIPRGGADLPQRLPHRGAGVEP